MACSSLWTSDAAITLDETWITDDLLAHGKNVPFSVLLSDQIISTILSAPSLLSLNLLFAAGAVCWHGGAFCNCDIVEMMWCYSNENLSGDNSSNDPSADPLMSSHMNSFFCLVFFSVQHGHVNVKGSILSEFVCWFWFNAPWPLSLWILQHSLHVSVLAELKHLSDESWTWRCLVSKTADNDDQTKWEWKTIVSLSHRQKSVALLHHFVMKWEWWSSSHHHLRPWIGDLQPLPATHHVPTLEQTFLTTFHSSGNQLDCSGHCGAQVDHCSAWDMWDFCNQIQAHLSSTGLSSSDEDLDEVLNRQWHQGAPALFEQQFFTGSLSSLLNAPCTTKCCWLDRLRSSRSHLCRVKCLRSSPSSLRPADFRSPCQMPLWCNWFLFTRSLPLT